MTSSQPHPEATSSASTRARDARTSTVPYEAALDALSESVPWPALNLPHQTHGPSCVGRVALTGECGITASAPIGSHAASAFARRDSSRDNMRSGRHA